MFPVMLWKAMPCPLSAVTVSMGGLLDTPSSCGRLQTGAPHERTEHPRQRKEWPMLWTIFVILLVLWLLGLVSSYTLGGYIHLLLVIAVVVVVIRLIQGRRPL